MRTKVTLATLLLVCACLSPAMADDDGGFKCNPDGNQQEMNQCAYEDWVKADEELNAVYKQALAFAASQDADLKEYQPELQGAVKALKKAQRAWVSYRDGQCESYGFGARGGSMEPLLIESCKADLTNLRVKELKDLMAGLEGEKN